MAPNLPSALPTPEAAQLDQLFDADVEAALASLTPDFRAAVVLCDVEGLTYEEIADVLGLICKADSVELWLYPDGTQIFELSTKCLPAEAFEVVAEAQAFLATRGIDLGAQQHTKTRTALEFFAAEEREHSTS